jgi:hypothetical protein
MMLGSRYIGQTLNKSLKTEKLSDIKGNFQKTSPSDTLYHLAQTFLLCLELGDTLVQFFRAAPERALHIFRLARQIVAQALLTNDQSEGPNKTFCNLAPITHLIPLSEHSQVDQKLIPLSSLMTMK